MMKFEIQFCVRDVVSDVKVDLFIDSVSGAHPVYGKCFASY